MSASIEPRMRLELRPRALTQHPVVAIVLDVHREAVLRLRESVPAWCDTDVEVVLRHGTDDQQPVEWNATVVVASSDDRIVTVSIDGEPEAVDRRRVSRPGAPVPIEWSQPPAAGRHVAYGVDLNRLGVRFRTGEGLEVRPDRIVLAIILPSGAITAQGRVVGVEGTEVRVEFVALHPDALRRLVAWEAEAVRGELATTVSPESDPV